MILSAAWQIQCRSNHVVAQFAAQELQRTLQRIGAPRLAIVSSTRPAQISLQHGAAGDGFVCMPYADGLRISGDGPRGLLFGCYALLEHLGCRWVSPGGAGEELPAPTSIQLPDTSFAEAAAVQRRVLILGHDSLLAAGADWITWAARARYTAIFVHTTPAALGLGACRLTHWRRRRAALIPLLRERGLSLELGGHHFSDLLPRRLLRRHPQFQRYDGERRVTNINACLATPAAQQALQAAAAAFARKEADVSVFHLWPDDHPSDGWCRCDACRPLSPADQALRFANCVAAGVADANPTARVSMLAYHETAVTPLTLTPAAGVELCFAPRTRSYADAINTNHALNQPQFADLVRLQAHFNRRPLIFEYYSDGLLHKSALPVFRDLLAADAAAYAAAGCDVALLITGDRTVATPGPTPYQLARLLWDPTHDPHALLADYLDARRSSQPQALAAAYHAAAEIWQVLLQHDAAERPPPIGALSLDLAGNPPRDALDLQLAPPALAERRLLRLEQCSHAAAALYAPQTAEESNAAAADWAELRALNDLWYLLLTRQRLAVLLNRQAPRTALLVALREARAAVARQQQRQRSSIHRADQTPLLTALHELQLDQLELRFAPLLRRFTLRPRALLRMIGALLSILMRRAR